MGSLLKIRKNAYFNEVDVMKRHVCRLCGQPLPSFDLESCSSQLHVAFSLQGGDLGGDSQGGTEVIFPRQECVCGQGNIKGLICPLEFLSAHSGSITVSPFQWSLYQSVGLRLISEASLKVHLPFSLHSVVFCAVRSFANWVTSSSFAFSSFKCSHTDYRASQHYPMSWEGKIGHGL